LIHDWNLKKGYEFSIEKSQFRCERESYEPPKLCKNNFIVLRKNDDFNVIFIENYNIYYREKGNASSHVLIHACIILVPNCIIVLLIGL
jgi:hypothetical protein